MACHLVANTAFTMSGSAHGNALCTGARLRAAVPCCTSACCFADGPLACGRMACTEADNCDAPQMEAVKDVSVWLDEQLKLEQPAEEEDE